jgi:hypothetical protein
MNLFKRHGVPLVITGWFTYLKLSTMGSRDPSHAYFMDLSWLTIGRGYGWYFDRLSGISMRWGGWMIVSFLLLCFLFVAKKRSSLFFVTYVFLTLLPVIPLRTHRFSFYGYIPFLGMVGLVATIVKMIEDFFRQRVVIHSGVFTAMALICFSILTFASFKYQNFLAAKSRQEAIDFTHQQTHLFVALKKLPSPTPRERVYVSGTLNWLPPDPFKALLRILFNRPDLAISFVQEFPAQANYRIVIDQSGTCLLQQSLQSPNTAAVPIIGTENAP